MATILPGAMNENAAPKAREDVAAADADYNHNASNATDCAGWHRVLVMPVKKSGGNGDSTITIQPLVLMDGTWAKFPALSPLKTQEAAVVSVYGRKVVWHVSALTADTVWDIHVGGADPMSPDSAQRG